ncbi:DUF6283 family protein [Glycomyces sp. NPDC047010]|uniref:DUF6283 family protein n=1 Tax=Glycomyces sp. NPDC047010 TaxID=3155023 RepID=UPI0033F539FF
MRDNETPNAAPAPASAFAYRHRSCTECPWRRDATPGAFTQAEFARMRETVEQPPGGFTGVFAPVFACHMTSPTSTRDANRPRVRSASHAIHPNSGLRHDIRREVRQRRPDGRWEAHLNHESRGVESELRKRVEEAAFYGEEAVGAWGLSPLVPSGPSQRDAGRGGADHGAAPRKGVARQGCGP